MPAIYEVGTAGTKQASQSEVTRQWYQRVCDDRGHWGRWLPLEPSRRPRWAWYNPQAGKSRLPDGS